MFAGANGLPDPATRATFAAGAANPVDLQIGPGGDLFYVDFSGGTIRRIQFTSGNQAPNCRHSGHAFVWVQLLLPSPLMGVPQAIRTLAIP